MKRSSLATAVSAIVTAFALTVGVSPKALTAPPVVYDDPALTFKVIAVQPNPTAGAGPTVATPPGTTYAYFFSTPYNTAVNETIPFYVCLMDEVNPQAFTWDTSVKVQSGPTPGVPNITTSATSWAFDETYPERDATTYPNPANDPACQAAYFTIATGALTPPGALPQILTSNTEFAMDGSGTSSNESSPSKGKTDSTLANPGKVQIKVEVTEPVVDDRISCYMTDSEGNVLLKCDGSLANESGEQDGTFAIVANKKKFVATNPGQFYYNLFWKNTTGSDQTVNVDIDTSSNLSANGAQAVHWWVLPTSSGVDLNDFDSVNQTGNPAGTSGEISGIVVLAGETLYVTYHLEWNGVGSPAHLCGPCGDALNEAVFVTGEVAGSFSGSPDSCTSGALGFDKPKE